jgi:beta-lactamase superfamily II metal-dependent hydrolase
MFGHPAPSTIQTLQHFDIQTYRTNEDGAVIITTDGTSEALTRMLP